MSSLTPSFLQLRRMRKRTQAKLALYRKQLTRCEYRLRGLESATADKMRAESLSDEAVHQAIDAEKRAEVLRVAAFDPASSNVWVWQLPTKEQRHHNCCAKQRGRSRGYNCCIFDPAHGLRLCDWCCRFKRSEERYTRYVSDAKLDYLRRKAQRAYMQGADLGLD
jgi:hypothetical protein